MPNLSTLISDSRSLATTVRQMGSRGRRNVRLIAASPAREEVVEGGLAGSATRFEHGLDRLEEAGVRVQPCSVSEDRFHFHRGGPNAPPFATLAWQERLGAVGAMLVVHAIPEEGLAAAEQFLGSSESKGRPPILVAHEWESRPIRVTRYHAKRKGPSEWEGGVRIIDRREQPWRGGLRGRLDVTTVGNSGSLLYLNGQEGDPSKLGNQALRSPHGFFQRDRFLRAEWDPTRSKPA